jgi:hypothetical protein
MNLFQRVLERIGNALRAPFRGMVQTTPHAKYVRMLEEEVARLRAENRALLNSLLGTAGIPPLEIPGGEGATRPAAMPTRRRSWPQIAQSLETLSRDAAAARNTPAREASAARQTNPRA